MSFTHFIFFFLLVSFFFTCKKNETRKIDISFYHWQSEFSLSSSEKKYVEKLSVNKIYTRFFDVDWDRGSAKPIAVGNVSFLDPLLPNLEVIPVVFITNRTITNIKDQQLEDLSLRIYNKINTKFHSIFSSIENLKEVQFDCDWTKKTKQKYFELLRLLDLQFEKQNVKLSATIRLHQIKYFKETGIPPVDKGMLMFYNTGDLENPQTENSILDINTAKKYLVNFDRYPLTLDIALPLFSWGILFRDDKMIKLINNLNTNHFIHDKRFEKVANNKFLLKKNTYLRGHYLYKGDWIKTEAVSNTILNQAANLLSQHIENQDLTITFYHLDTSTIKHYSYEQLDEVCKKF